VADTESAGWPAGSARLGLRVATGAAKSEIVGRYGEGWKVRVAARPERGRANEALLDLLARSLEIPRSGISLVAGASARDKVVEIQGLTRAEADRRLGARQRRG
jgi:uncharacterized protein YggU (UPF0235/DUF167 family)